MALPTHVVAEDAEPPPARIRGVSTEGPGRGDVVEAPAVHGRHAAPRRPRERTCELQKKVVLQCNFTNTV